MTLTLRRFMMLGFIALLFVSSGSTVQALEKPLIPATTTSTQDTGLLDVLIPIFEKKAGYFVKTIAVTLCDKSNSKANFSREYWESLYKEIIK